MDYIKGIFLAWAEIVDAWRIAPRAVLIFYAWMLLKITLWFMGLPDPTAEQSGVVMAIWGTAALIFNFYAKSGRAWGPQVEWDNVGTNPYLAAQRDRYYGSSRSRSRPRRRNYDTVSDVNQEEEDA